MSISVKTNFTAGQVSKNLFGRGDLSIYENGARKLENVIIHPTGGVSRRFGTQYIDEQNQKCRLLPFEFNTEQAYLFCFYDKGLKIYKEGVCIKTLEAPWTEEQIFEFSWTQSADVLLIVHKDVPPQQISRYSDDNWLIEQWRFYAEDNGMMRCPFFNFFNKKESIKPDNATTTGKLTATRAIFDESYVGRYIKIQEGLVFIEKFTSSTVLNYKVICALKAITATVDWEENVFNATRGWPASVTFHQDRLVIGGSRALPNRLWLSKSSDLFNFDLGKALDDEAIEFAILSDQVNAIKSVVSSRHLLVLTTGTEYMVSGEPLTPETIQLRRQTSVGSYNKKNIAPQQVDGATIFISQSGRQLREFLYTDVEQAYQATDLTLMANDIINKPTDMSFDPNSNVLYITQEDGTISCLTSYRIEQVNAWSKLITNGKYISVCVSGDDVYFCTEREGKFFIEKQENTFFVDCGIKLTSDEPQKVWNGLDYLEGMEVMIVADGFYASCQKVTNGTIELLDDASEIIVGLAYEHIIEPLPFVVEAGRPYPPKAYRIISSLYRILDSSSFIIDTGKGYFSVPLRRMSDDKIIDAPPVNYSGDIQLRSLGWIRDMEQPMWSIRSDEPSSFTLLSVVNEIKTKE